MYILNKIFDFDITSLASFVTAVDYSSQQDCLFVIFVHLLWLSNNTHKVEWTRGEVDCQCTSSCTLFFSKLLTKNYNNMFEFVKVIVQNNVNPDTVKTALSMMSQLHQH